MRHSACRNTIRLPLCVFNLPLADVGDMGLFCGTGDLGAMTDSTLPFLGDKASVYMGSDRVNFLFGVLITELSSISALQSN